jgi:outer membrane protein assembly factor BamB
MYDAAERRVRLRAGMSRARASWLGLVAFIGAAALAFAGAGAGAEGGDDGWRGWGNTPENTRLSPLTQITKANVDQLGRMYTVNFRTFDPIARLGEQSYPVVVGDRMYIANGQDPEHGEGVGHMYCIDATKRGDITKTGLVWHYDKIRRSISTPAIADGLIYQPDFSGFLHCLDAKTGQRYWYHDTKAPIWSSPYYVDGKVYLGNDSKTVYVFEHGTKLKKPAEMDMGSRVRATPVAANGTLYVMTENKLYAIAAKK